jgi:predicted solute-binding protein
VKRKRTIDEIAEKSPQQQLKVTRQLVQSYLMRVDHKVTDHHLHHEEKEKIERPRNGKRKPKH